MLQKLQYCVDYELESIRAMSSFFFVFSIASIVVAIKASEPNSSATTCIHGGPSIRHPFHLQTQNTNLSGYPGFDLFCEDNNTILHFPSYGNLVVKSISYDTKKIDLFTPKTCVHEVFLNLNLSLTPFFLYYYKVKSYKYLNCSSKNSIPPSLSEVPCLSGDAHHVFVVEPERDFPKSSCRAVKTVSIPFEYSPYLDDNHFGLALTWNSAGGSDEFEDVGMIGFQTRPYFKLRRQVYIMSLIALMVVAILVLSKMGQLQKEEQQCAAEDEESVGEYIAINVQLYES